VDGYTDTFDAASSSTGEAADMELGALTGQGPPQLSAIADGDPVLAPERIVVLGHRHQDDLEDARELELVDAGIARVDARDVRARGPAAVAAFAAERLRETTDAVWLHLDVDVLDEQALPAVSYRQPGGLGWDELAELLAPLLAAERLAGMSIADLQADLDPDGRYARRIVELLPGR
jgi:arginase